MEAIVGANAKIPNKTILNFHKNRTMFLIKDDELFLANKGDYRSHIDWIREDIDRDNIESIIENCTRGYILNDEIYFYTGNNFNANLNTIVDMLKNLTKIYLELEIKSDLKVYLGLIPKYGEVFKGNMYVGKLSDRYCLI